MNWDRIKGNWKQFTGKAKEGWGNVTGNDHKIVAGQRDQLAGKMQEGYGAGKEKVEEVAKKLT